MTTIETTNLHLEELLEGDVVCQSKNPMHTCTVLAVAVNHSACKHDDVLWCQARLDVHEYGVRKFGVQIQCNTCGASVLNCWTIRPI